MTTSKGGAEFETALKQDLPRGFERQARIVGRDRGLTSRWLQPDEMVGNEWTTEGGLLLGYRAGRVIGWNDDRHLLTIAGSRAGKGVSLLIPNLITYRGSAVVVDPKGENAARTARWRGQGLKPGEPGLGQIVHVLDPFGETGLTSSAFNPLAMLDPRSPDIVDDIGLFADALITHPDQGERHWTEAAQGVLRALILMVVVDPLFADRRHLVTVRRLLMLTDPSIEIAQTAWAELMASQAEEGDPPPRELTGEQALIKLLRDQDQAPYGDICVGVGEQLMAMADKERGSVLSAGRTQTQWLDSPAMLAVLSGKSFDLADLKRKAMTIYLCLPATRMATHSRWLRLIVMLAIGMMERIKAKPKQPVLFVLDEFPVLGYMQSIETAAGLMAGFGVKLWPIVQNIGQLKRHYSRSWETFVANSGLITAFGVGDTETLEVLSKYLGHTGIAVQTDSMQSRDQRMHGSAPLHEDRREPPLLATDELRIVFGRRKGRALVFNVEENPAIVERFVYYMDDRFAGKFDPDPNHGPQP